MTICNRCERPMMWALKSSAPTRLMARPTCGVLKAHVTVDVSFQLETFLGDIFTGKIDIKYQNLIFIPYDFILKNCHWPIVGMFLLISRRLLTQLTTKELLDKRFGLFLINISLRDFFEEEEPFKKWNRNRIDVSSILLYSEKGFFLHSSSRTLLQTIIPH